MKLYELTAEYQQVLDMIGEVEDDVIIDTLESIEGEIELKFENMAKIIKSIESANQGRKKEIERISKDVTTSENTIKHLKTCIEQTMRFMNKTKIKSPSGLFSFNIQKNPPALVFDDPKGVPEEFLIQQDPKPDNAAIKERLKAGEVFSFAHLSSSESLRIR